MVAREINLSVSTVIRIFDLVSYYPQKLPVALSIDEFKGNTNSEKYQCILTDPVNKVVLDILPKRYESNLTKYFNFLSAKITNGFTEGYNNKIKVLKRNAYGYRNFRRFRNRILHIFSHQTQKQATA